MLKKQLIILFCMLAGFLAAQVPQGINYQAVARNGNGDILSNQNVSIVFNLRNPINGFVDYSESHSTTTNDFGLFNLVIGAGNNPSGDFSDVDWSNNYELGVSVNGVNLGFTLLQSVPYALAVSPRRDVLSIPAGVFVPNRNDIDYLNSIGSGGVTITSDNDPGGAAVLNAPLYLPNGSRVTAITAFFEDESDVDLEISFIQELFTSSFSTEAAIVTSGNESGIREETMDTNIFINNSFGGYFIRVFCTNWNAAGTKRIKGVRIEYTY
ncbi:MAG: hypothetical protein AAGF87_09890 [Bacteroidota bacterium]